jgi:hypothetical protein
MIPLLGFGIENKKNSGTTKTKPKNGSRKMQTRLSILLPSCNRSTDALLSQRKMLMESRRSVKMNTPTNRSNHRGVPRTKIERTISLRLIHTYGVEDPAGLRRPELGASGVERREEQHFEIWWRSDLQERREEGQP